MEEDPEEEEEEEEEEKEEEYANDGARFYPLINEYKRAELSHRNRFFHTGTFLFVKGRNQIVFPEFNSPSFSFQRPKRTSKLFKEIAKMDRFHLNLKNRPLDGSVLKVLRRNCQKSSQKRKHSKLINCNSIKFPLNGSDLINHPLDGSVPK